MMKECQEFDSVIEEAKNKLESNNEWEERFAGYAKAINENITKIKDRKKQFRERPPLYLYINVNVAKDSSKSVKFSLRYLGQDVANLIANGQDVLLSTAGYSKSNTDNFGCGITLGGRTSWESDDAACFRKYFQSYPKRKDIGKNNDEHRIESDFLTQLSGNVGIDKAFELHNIHPVKIAGICRFQMPTPLSASTGKVKYLAKGHGHIDILARVGKGRGAKLCIMEVKDEYEQPAKVLKQGLIYAVFISDLLRGESGKEWWKIFGFNKPIPVKLVLNVACVMPFPKSGIPDKSFANKQVEIGDDVFKFHYVYLKESEGKKQIETSFVQRSCV